MNGTNFPYAVIAGIAGKFAQLYSSYIESPPEFLYFSFLTCLGSLLADKITLETELQPQPRIYCVLIGDSGDPRKSTAADQVIKFFQDTFADDFHTCYGVGSAEGLQKKLTEIEPQKLLIFFDELKSFVSKCKIDGSVLLPCVNTLFESNRYESHTKTTSIELKHSYLSILGCTTKQTFDGMWSSQFTDIGFNNRLFLVPGIGKKKFPIPLRIPQNAKDEIKKKLAGVLKWIEGCGQRVEFELSEDAWLRFDHWYKHELESSIHAKRLETYALRLMPLLAVNEGKTEIDYTIVEKVIALAEWQLEVRRELDPIDAENTIAGLEERIRRRLQKCASTKRQLQQFCNASRYGSWCFETALNNLLKYKQIMFDKKDCTYLLMENCSQKCSHNS